MLKFKIQPGFCSVCGSILPVLLPQGSVTCHTCAKEYSPEAFRNVEETYEIHFNSRDMKETKEIKNENEDEGTLVERKCPKCGNDKMSYETLQLRSADEGQTVFYTCIKCKFKDTENS